jgi:hypothetical protein
MLDEAPDLSVRVITAGAGTWLIHGEIFLSITLASASASCVVVMLQAVFLGCGVVSEAR